MNEFIFRSAVRLFLCPGTRLACFKFQADTACFLFQVGSPERVQGAVSRRRLWRMQAGEGPMRHRAQVPALAPVPARQCRIVEEVPWCRDEPPMTACGRSTNDRLRRAEISFVLRSTEREQSLLWRVATFEVAGNISSAVRSAETSNLPMKGSCAD